MYVCMYVKELMANVCNLLQKSYDIVMEFLLYMSKRIDIDKMRLPHVEVSEGTKKKIGRLDLIVIRLV